jgi:hypothetical protein
MFSTTGGKVLVITAELQNLDPLRMGYVQHALDGAMVVERDLARGQPDGEESIAVTNGSCLALLEIDTDQAVIPGPGGKTLHDERGRPRIHGKES